MMEMAKNMMKNVISVHGWRVKCKNPLDPTESENEKNCSSSKYCRIFVNLDLSSN
jgi:hypothetical protein